jgi:exosortase K
MSHCAALPRRRGPADLVAFGVFALFAYVLKQRYSAATPEELRFILAPTAQLIELGTNARWPFEAGVGYVSTAHATAIVPACAGVNFWIIAAATLVFGWTARFERLRAKLWWVAGSVLVAFVCTLLVNALRIGSDLAVRELVLRELALGPHVHAELHRVLGVVVYLGSACLLHAGAGRCLGGLRAGEVA